MTDEEIELWVDVSTLPKYKDFYGYEVSNLGRVRSWRPRNRNANAPEKPRMIKFDHSQTGSYEWMCLYSYEVSMRVRVHDLVAAAFIGDKPVDGIVRHLDDNPLNNRADNLTYGTTHQNHVDKMVNRKSDNLLKRFDEVGVFCHDIAIAKGFWSGHRSPDTYVAKMGLIHSEISEILEAYRKQHGPEKLTEEFADVFIRLVDLWAAMYEDGLTVSLRDMIIDKIHINRDRPYRHGNLI